MKTVYMVNTLNAYLGMHETTLNAYLGMHET